MRKKHKKFFKITSLSLLILGTLLTINGVRHTGLQIARILNRISYSLEDQIAAVLYTDEHIKIPVVFHPQEHALSCEVAAARMVLNYFGVDVTEDELLRKLTFDTRGSKSDDGVWGDPDKGFVGDINGSVFDGTGYGVYEKPIASLIFNYRDAYVLKNATLRQVIDEVDKGNPVIVWGLLSNTEPLDWQTNSGKYIIAYPGEHARIVMGYSGDSQNPTKIILMDPIYGKIRVDTDRFLYNWRIMENRAVVIY